MIFQTAQTALTNGIVPIALKGKKVVIARASSSKAIKFASVRAVALAKKVGNLYCDGVFVVDLCKL